jgi:hypothetical protein
VVDDEVRRHERVDQPRVAAELGHRVAHCGEVDDGRHAGEVLEDDPRRHERNLGLAAGPGPPPGQGLDVLGLDEAIAGVTQDVLEQDLERDRRAFEVDQSLDRGEAVEIRQPRAEAGPRAEGVPGGRGSALAFDG